MCARADGEVHVLLSEPESAYEEAARSFQNGLGTSRDIRVWTVAELSPEQLRNLSEDANLIVPIGLKATRFVAGNFGGRGAVLGLMVPKTSAENISWARKLASGRLAFVYIDQPVERSLALLETLLPRKGRIGVMVSPENGEILKALEKEAERRGLSLNATLLEDASEVGPSLRRILADSDIFLLLPDALVLNGANLQSLLMASYRLRVPVIGFSPGLVKSGAVAAVFSSPAQIGWQGGLLARRWLANGVLPASQHAGQFSIDINSYVARSLGLSLPPKREVVKSLGATP
jgi:ABC-type uncharacterized transport system substrate-binding protein